MPRCPYCNNESTFFFVARDLNRRVSTIPFSYYRCPDCGLVFLNDIPKDLSAYYPENYYILPKSLSELDERAGDERFKLDLITPFFKSGKMLEVGPAFGNFAYLAKKAGFEVEVIEMDSRCCQFIHNIAGIKVTQASDIVQAVHGKDTYDVIALWHVIEHLSDFKQVLDVLVTKLNKNGILVIAAPNPEAMQFKLLGRFWAHLDTPRHIVLIPVSLLIKHLSRYNLTVVSITTTDSGGLGLNKFGWQNSLTNLVDSRFAKKILFNFGSFLSRITAPFENSGRTGCAYTIIFRKEREA